MSSPRARWGLEACGRGAALALALAWGAAGAAHAQAEPPPRSAAADAETRADPSSEPGDGARAAAEAQPGAAPDGGAGDGPAPACIESCRALEASGELSEGVSELGCLVRVCHEDARRLYESRDFDAALRSLRHIEAWVEFSPAYQLDRGLVLYALGRFDDAVAGFDAVLEVYPESVRASAQRAHALVRLGRTPEARAQLERMLGFETAEREYRDLLTRSYILGNLAVLRLAEGDLEAAQRGLQEALDVDPRNELARTYRDRVLPELEARRAAPEVVPKLIAAFEELALGRANAALRELSGVLSQWPDFKLGYLLAADTQRRYRDYAGCETTLRVALGRFPDDTRLLVERIRCTLMRHGVHSDAALASVAELKRLAASSPDDPLVREILLLLEP